MGVWLSMNILNNVRNILSRSSRDKFTYLSKLDCCSLFDAMYENRSCCFKVYTKECVDRLAGLFHGNTNTDGYSPIYGLAWALVRSGSRSEAFNYLEDYYQNVNEIVVSSERYVVLSDESGDASTSEFKLPWEGCGRISHKTRLYGPVDKNYINSEIDRTLRLLRSIEKKGYRSKASTDPIRGYLLINEDQYRFVVKGGQHRVAVLSALGFDEVDVTWQPNWPRIIIKDHSKWWPHVRDGSIDVHRALDEFDRFFS